MEGLNHRLKMFRMTRKEINKLALSSWLLISPKTIELIFRKKASEKQ